MQQQHDITQEWKRNFNIAYTLGVIYQRAFTVVTRSHFGSQALGMPTFLALVFMGLFYVATADSFMLIWIAAWLICLVKRRAESINCAAHIPSQYDGVPRDAMMFTKSERIARMVVEPLMIGLIGLGLKWVYEECGWSPAGLPWFFINGMFALAFVEVVGKSVWDRKIQAIRDAKLEQQSLMEDYQNRYGDQ
ncbi:MAG TPA: hypothetical protein VH592_13315 [Gemmataceae bacterium]|jgi:hypothetical protein